MNIIKPSIVFGIEIPKKRIELVKLLKLLGKTYGNTPVDLKYLYIKQNMMYG